jgi:hypothetical protein
MSPSKGGGAPPHGPRGGGCPPLIMPVENWNSRMKLFSPQLAGPYANLVTSPNGYFYRARLPVRSLSLFFSLSLSFSLPLLLFALLGDLMNYALHRDFIECEWLCFRDRVAGFCIFQLLCCGLVGISGPQKIVSIDAARG